MPQKKIPESFRQLLELKCMAVEGKTVLSLRGDRDQKLSHALIYLRIVKDKELIRLLKH